MAHQKGQPHDGHPQYDEGRASSRSYPRPRHPQKVMSAFWDYFTTSAPGKIHQILPRNPYAESRSARLKSDSSAAHPAHTSYGDAKEICIKAVEKIAAECKRCNMRYRDPHFDMEWDLKTRSIHDCLSGLDAADEYTRDTKDGEPQGPLSVKRGKTKS